MSLYSSFFFYNFLYELCASPNNQNELHNELHSNNEKNNTSFKCSVQKEVLLKIGSALLSVSGAVLPLYLLWKIELHDREEVQSSGFDKFIAWATFTSVPLATFKVLDTYEEIYANFKKHLLYKDNNNITQLDNVGAKLAVYGVGSLALVARGIMLYKMTSEIMEYIEVEETASDIVSFTIGSIAINSIYAVAEHSKLKQLFSSNQALNHSAKVTLKQICFALFSAIEGSWFALPAVGISLTAMEEFNPLLKGALLFPMWLSSSVYESSNMYEAIIPNRVEEQTADLIGNNDLEDALV
jgi:hypothetical protein